MEIDLLKATIIKSIAFLSFILLLSLGLGFAISEINDLSTIEELLETQRPALPSVLKDRNGLVITEFYSDEKRDIVTLDKVPEHFIKGLIAYEDASFYTHKGFNAFAILRAVFNNIIGKPISGASTLTQQLARTLFLNNERSIKRKIRELWIALQLEKKYTKNEILALYINNVPFGLGTNGVQSAANFYFGVSAENMTPAQSASLITLISNPTYYSPIRFPQHHQNKQKKVLEKMVSAGIITQSEADFELNQFWVVWSTVPHSDKGAFFRRTDLAPYFSDWVANEIEKELPNVDLYRDGLIIHSTLDLRLNQLAEKLLVESIERQQRIFEVEQVRNNAMMQNRFIEGTSLLGVLFSLRNVQPSTNRITKQGLDTYQSKVNGPLNLLSQVFQLDMVKTVTDTMYTKTDQQSTSLPLVQGAFFAMDNETGQVISLVGGRQFSPSNRFNYAMQSRRQPGSSFKPLIYSYALDTGRINAATVIDDTPTIFDQGSEDPGVWYRPYNYDGVYYGPISLRRALRLSLNIPAVKVFHEVGRADGYKSAIDRAAMLMGINSQAEIDRRFSYEISTVLGTPSVSLYEMVRAFHLFANKGQRRTPSYILSIQDRNRRVIYEPWVELERYYRENRRKLQVISTGNAFILADILKDTVHRAEGFLYKRRVDMINEGLTFPDIELAAKTGTSQNWADAWLIGFSPAVTAGCWMGFDRYGLSLGFNQNGSLIHGHTWMEWMRQFHLGKGSLEFEAPNDVIQVRVCKHSGRLPSSECNASDLYVEYFLRGTVSRERCHVCGSKHFTEQRTIDQIGERFDMDFDSENLFDSNEFNINVDNTLLNDMLSSSRSNSSIRSSSSASSVPTVNTNSSSSVSSTNNSSQSSVLLDDLGNN